MRKLLRANFYRLCRSRALWLCMAGVFAFSVFFMLSLKSDPGDTKTLDEVIMQVFPFLPVAHAAFVSLFLGVEYQDGTLRNKLIAGHSRCKVYGASFITAAAGCFAILLAWALGGIVGVIRFGWFTAPAGAVMLNVAVILLLTAATASILTILGMLLTNRAASAVISIMLVFGLIMLGSVFYNALCEPEMSSAAMLTENGFEVGEAQPNPYYVSGVLREIYQFAVDALPSGQAILLANQELTHPGLSLCASLSMILLLGGVGMAIFKRKDLK